MPPVATITTNTTTAAKEQGCGTYSFKSTGSTLGAGRGDEHLSKWEITSYPEGFEFTTIDPRFIELAGQPASSVINARDGGWFGWSFSFPMTHAGDYTIRLTIIDINGDSSTATATVTVSPFSGAEFYLDENAVGSGDGTSWADAWTTLDSALNVIANQRGGNAILHVKSGTSYTPSTLYDFRDDYNVGIHCDDPEIGFTLDRALGGGFRFRGIENITVSGMIAVNSSAANSGNAIESLSSGADDVYLHRCRTGGANRLVSFIEATITSNNPRFLLHNCENTVGAQRYALAYLNAQLDVLGGTFENNTDSTEAVMRLAEPDDNGIDGISTLNAVNITARLKSCVRYADGEFHTLSRCKLRGLEGGTWISTWFGHPTDTAGRVRIDRNSCYGSGAGLDPFIKCGDNSWSTVHTNASITFAANVLEVFSTGSGNRMIDFDDTQANNVYACTIVGNTIISNSPDIGTLVQVPVELDLLIEGNLFIYTGAESEISFIDVRPGSGDTIVRSNVFSPGAASNANPYRVNSSPMDIDSFNSQSGFSGNSEGSVSIDDDYFPSGAGMYESNGAAPFDYYSNELSGQVSRGAVLIDEPQAVSTVNTSRLVSRPFPRESRI